MVRPTDPIPITPWFRARMSPDDVAWVRLMRMYGHRVRGYAMHSRGPFTALVAIDGRTLVGVGSSPSEAIERLAAKVESEGGS